MRERVREWALELVLLAVGVGLRVAFARAYDPHLGYDVESHWKSVEWFVGGHVGLPDPTWSRTAYHPPLYYAIAAWLVRHGAQIRGVQWLSVAAGAVRLGALLVGLRLFLPGRPLARAVALAVAAVVPASVHLDAMVNCEALVGALAALALLGGAAALDGEGRRRWGWALAGGLCLGLALLTKVSAFAVGIALAGAVGFELVWPAPDAGPGARRARLVPFLVAGLVTVAVSGWLFVHNARAYGKPVLTGYDGKDAFAMAPFKDLPVWRRRNPSFVLGWSADIYRVAAYPSGVTPRPVFFPVVVASTFADFYRYHFSPSPRHLGRVAHAPSTATGETLARASVAGGTVLALAAVGGLLAAAVVALRRRRAGVVALALAPVAMIGGQLFFAWKYPVDWEGPIKGVYMQFAALPLCGAAGLAVDWLWRRRGGARVVAIVVGLAIVPVLAYVLYAAFGPR